MSKKDRGFASMDTQLKIKIAGQGGKTAHALGRAHKWTPEEARRAGKLSALKQRLTGRTYVPRPNPTRPKLLALLQDSLTQRPGKPVSFVALANTLGISRQYARRPYHQLKNEHPVPPVGKKGFGASHTRKRTLIPSKAAATPCIR